MESAHFSIRLHWKSTGYLEWASESQVRVYSIPRQPRQNLFFDAQLPGPTGTSNHWRCDLSCQGEARISVFAIRPKSSFRIREELKSKGFEMLSQDGEKIPKNKVEHLALRKTFWPADSSLESICLDPIENCFRKHPIFRKTLHYVIVFMPIFF